MTVFDLTDLSPTELADYERRFQQNLAFYRTSEVEAAKRGNGQLYRVAATVALKDIRNRRQPVRSVR
ncbi:hypothetical protein LJR098_001102 [Rhizobium sp. LjRoot98]|uniref:hypothetical protein n=1 Tax=Rhizobium sp. LjRoot98 TaxID=3342345 RepID=UPI003ECDCBD1